MRPGPGLVAFVLAPCLVLAGGHRAAAQSAEAQELFDEGRRALAAGDYAKACTKLDASERIERAVGTLLSLAQCEEGLGQLASERLHLQEAATWADATHDPLNRAPIARRRFEEIDRRVPRLTLQRTPDAPLDSHVTRDGVDLGASAFDAALPVDAGSHVIVVSAPGRADARYEVTLKEGEQRTLAVGPAGNEVVAARSTGPLGWPRRTWAYALGGVGVAGIAVGSVFGVRTFSTWSQAQRDCGTGCAPGLPAHAEANAAHTDAAVSTVAFLAGGAALAAGAYLYFFAKPASASTSTGVRVAPWMTVGAAGASVGGAWR